MPTANLPTAQQVLASNESKHLFRSNLLRLQLDELHTSISPVYEKLSKVDKLVATTCVAVSEVNPVTIPANCSTEYPDVVFHGPMLSAMSFSKPSAVEVVGSYKTRSMVKPLQAIDVLVVMPSACFGEKDIKGHRYFDRRTAYCAELRRQLGDKLSSFEVSVEYWHGDRNKAMVVVSVANSQWKIRLLPCVSPTTFPLTKLGAAHKNLSESTVCDPLYNASVMEDMFFSSDVYTAPKILHFARAVQLAKVWLYRRNSLVTESNSCGLSGFQIRVILSHITHNMPREVSAYQLFKLFVSLLAKTDFAKTVLVHGSTATRPNTSGIVSIECEALGQYNPLWRVPVALMAELQLEAQQSMTLLDDMTVSDPYESLFCAASRVRDFTVSIPGADSWFDARATADSVCASLERGLGDRLYSKRVYVRYSFDAVVVSGDIDASSASSVIDKGPSADSAEAASFRAFWGTKSELRRFKDGSILECVVWQKSSTLSVAEQIIRHVMDGRNAEISVTPLGACQGVSASHVALWGAMETLRTKLTAVQQLPISILTLRPSHARFTGTDLAGTTTKPLDCIIEFESSQAWPATRVSVWHTKCAFLLAIREGLMRQYCSVEIAAEDFSEEPFIDVRLTDLPQFAFRLRIFANVELARVNQQLASDSAPALSEIATAAQLYFEPMLRVRMHALSAVCPAITGAIRIAKEWMDNHLLLESWLHHWVEVTMAHVAELNGNAVQSPHVLVLHWFFFIANHAFRTAPVFATLGSESVDKDVLGDKYAQAVDERKSWWISSDIDPDCLFLRRPLEWEAERIQTLARQALEFAEKREWEKIRVGTDNSRVFDVLMKVKTEQVGSLDEHVKTLNEQFRKYMRFHFSKRHGLIGAVLEPAAFRPQSNATLEKSKLLVVVDKLAVPDVVAITSKLARLTKGIAENIKIRA